MAAHRYRLAVQSVKSESIIADNDYPERLLKIHRRIYLLSFDFFLFFFFDPYITLWFVGNFTPRL